MTYRSKAGLKSRIDLLAPSNQTSEISAADVRELLGDIVDSYVQGEVPPVNTWQIFYESVAAQDQAQLTAILTADYIRVNGVRSQNLQFPPFTAAADGNFAWLVPESYQPIRVVTLEHGDIGFSETQISDGYTIGGLAYVVVANLVRLTSGAWFTNIIIPTEP